LRELALAQEDTHGLSSLGYVWTTGEQPPLALKKFVSCPIKMILILR
jgi:hypothetical protein